MSRKMTVVVVDDHPVVRRGISSTFAEEPDFDVVGEGGSAEHAIALVLEKRPDLVVLDVTMPGGGIDAARTISQDRPETAILMLSVCEDLTTVRSALRAGASGYVSKGVGGDDLVGSARRILAGDRYVSPELAARLITDDRAAREPTSDTQQVGAVRATLTKREREIFELLAEGLSNQEISARVGLSENTVKHYMTPLMQKLGVRNRTEAALAARSRLGAKKD
jgi:two-component system, NarL family, nitrate/nitrite response regulator NarL